MSKLNKTLYDYFQIPILLRAVGDTTPQTLRKFQTIFNKYFTNVRLEEQDCLDLADSMKDFQKNKVFNNYMQNETQVVKLLFMAKDFNTDWPQFQVIYRCHITIGIYDGKQNDPTKLKEAITRLNKQMQDERRRLVSLFVKNIEREKCYELDIGKHFIFVPQVPDEDLANFLEPAIVQIAKQSLIYIVEEVRKLKSDDNQIIVFNKNEERPESKSLKKKKKGRCLKLAGDYCLTLQAEEDAFNFYKQAMSSLKSIDDYHWMMGVEQGRAAAYLLKYILLPQQQNQTADVQTYIEYLNELTTNAIQFARKAKLTHFESQCYFKILNAHKEIENRQGVDEWASQFCSQSLKNYVFEEQVIFLGEMAMLFEELSMLRKRNYYLTNAALLYLQKKPEISRMMLSYIKDNTPALPLWKELYMRLLKQLLKCDTMDSYMGKLQVQLLSVCSSKLTTTDINDLVQRLNYSLLSSRPMQIKLLTIKKLLIEESPRKPKDNRIGQAREVGGVVAPWKKQGLLKFQVGEPIKFLIQIDNPLPVPLNLKYRMLSQPDNDNPLESCYMESLKNCTFPVNLILNKKDDYRISALQLHLWGFITNLPLGKEFRIEIYEGTSAYSIQCPDEITIERSAKLDFTFQLRNNNHIKSSRMKLNVSVYYNIETGLQQNIYIFEQEALNNDILKVRCLESNKKGCDCSIVGNQLTMNLDQLRVHRTFLRKLQICIDYVTQATSKYQISAVKGVNIQFTDSIQCHINRISQINDNRMLQQGRRVINNRFIVSLAFSKNSEDLKAYQTKIIMSGNVIDEFILSERAEIVRNLTLMKINNESEEQCMKVFKNLLTVEWQCITNPQLTGRFQPVLAENLKSQTLIGSNKVVSVNFLVDGQEVQELRVKKGSRLTISYEIKDSKDADCSHQVILHSQGIRQRNLGYCIQGKTTVKGRAHVKNRLHIQFQANYSSTYLLALRFQEEIFICDRFIIC